MSSFVLRSIAIITMLIDHIGVIFLGGSKYYHIFRIIGRLSFPIFCFLAVEGVYHTKNIKKYAGRMLAFAVISEVPYDLAFHDTLFYPAAQNVFWTLFLGVVLVGLCVYVPKIKYSTIYQIGLTLVVAYVAYLIYGDYDASGILLIFLLALIRVKGPIYQGITNAVYMLSAYGLYIQSFAGLSGIFMGLYNGKAGSKRLKYFFYLFYPAHLLLLYGIKQLFF